MKKNKFLFWLTRISAIVWVSCIVAVILLIAVSTKGFSGTIQDTEFGNSSLFTTFSISFIGLGFFAFGVLILSVIINNLLEKKILKFERSFRGFLGFIFKLFLIVVFLPLFILDNASGFSDLLVNIKKNGFKFYLLKPKNVRARIGRLITVLGFSLIILPIWVGGYILIGTLIKAELGYSQEPITIAGTGSMYPTFPKGQGKTPQELAKEIVGAPGMLSYPNGLVINGKRFFGYQLGRGDIVVVENDKIREMTKNIYGDASGWVKRIVGMSGDNIELREGIVYLNGEPLKEPYTAQPHSTFGETFLSECKKTTVPDNSIFVMGDNRKGSGDSREIGFISIKDINHVLPFKSQKGTLDNFWRDTSKDLEESSKIKLDKQKYVDLLNEKRKEAKVKPLKYQPKLENSAFKRGEVILKYDDFSFEATRSGYTMARAMADSGYYNIVYGEAPQLGYYEAEELIENQFEFPETKKFLLNNDYQEIGISEVEGTLNGCPAQVLVQHFAGYVPPNYKKEDVENWRNTVGNLNSIIPSWEKAVGWKNMNQEDLKRLLDLLYRERAIALNILAKMDSNKWLTRQEEDSIKEYDSLAKESIALANKLNGR